MRYWQAWLAQDSWILAKFFLSRYVKTPRKFRGNSFSRILISDVFVGKKNFVDIAYDIP